MFWKTIKLEFRFDSNIKNLSLFKIPLKLKIITLQTADAGPFIVFLILF
jgi:hypothetical protein